MKRVFLTLGAFWLTGIIAMGIMSDSPGSLSTWFIAAPVLAFAGLFVGPFFFAGGLLGNSASATPGMIILILGVALLSYIGYIKLFLGAAFSKKRSHRLAYLFIEALCAFIAVQGLINSI